MLGAFCSDVPPDDLAVIVFFLYDPFSKSDFSSFSFIDLDLGFVAASSILLVTLFFILFALLTA